MRRYQKLLLALMGTGAFMLPGAHCYIGTPHEHGYGATDNPKQATQRYAKAIAIGQSLRPPKL